jgi:undecaprenol kinase
VLSTQTPLVEELTSYSESYCPAKKERRSFPVFQAMASAWASERSLRMHGCICLSFVVIGVILNFDLVRWAITILGMSILIAVELVNSALERLADQCVGKTFSSLVKEAKDLSAGAVLTVGIALLLAGFVVCFSTPLVQSLFH